MHLNENDIRALLDQELSANQAEKVQEHINHCPKCRDRLSKVQATANRVQAHMNAITPAAGEQPPSPHLAYARLIKSPRLSAHRKEPIFMFTRRPLWTALAVIAILAVVFTLTPASAWASNFLGLFRVQKITVVQFDPEAAHNAGESLDANEELIKQVLSDNMVISEGGDAVKVESVEAAAAQAGFTPRLPALENPQLAVQPGMSAVLTINQEQMQALLDITEIDFDLPESIDGETVTVEAKETVLAGYGCQPEQREAAPQQDCVVLVQLPSPTINAPEGLNVQKVGQAMLTFLGMPAPEAEALSQQIDWTTTLILPIPQGEGIQYQEMAVDGVTGTFIQEEGENSYMLLWVKDGFLYGLKGPGGAEDALNIAGTIQ